MAMVGYNAIEVKKLETSIDSAYSDVYGKWNEIWKEIEDGISAFLFTPEGKTKLVPQLYNKMVERANLMTKDFDVFVEAINMAMKNWSTGIGKGDVKLISSKFPKVNITYQKKILDHDANNNQGVNEVIARDFLGKLSDYKTRLASSIESHKSDVKASAAFLGGDQDLAVEALFQKLITSLANYFDEAQNEITSKVQEALDRYGSIAAKNVTTLNETTFGA